MDRTGGGVHDPDEDPLSRTLAVIGRLIDHMTEAVIVIRHDHQVVTLNQATVDLLDLPERAVGLRSLDSYGDIVTSWRTGDRQSDAPSELARALTGEQIRDQRATVTTSAGEERQISFSATPIFADGDDVQFAMLTMQDRTESERDRRYWQAVGSAATGLTGRLAVEQVLNSAMDVTVAALGGEVVLGIWRLDEAEQRLHLRVHRGISDETAATLESIPLDTQSLICEAATEREVRYEEDLSQTPPRHEFDRELARRESLGSWITGPLVADERLVGAMGYGLRRAKRLFSHEISAVATIGSLFAIAIVHAELYEQSEGRRDALEMERDRRSRFTGAIAHDLRQPLTVIGGNARLALRTDLSDEQRELIEEIQHQAGRLNRMAADLTDTAQIAAGQFTVQREWTDLPDLVRRTASSVQRANPGHRIRVVEAPAELEGEWDHDRLSQVMENLLTNAVKFSPGGGDIDVRVARTGGEVTASVHDNGIGIAREDLDRLFESFARPNADRGGSGTGLGLSIARSIVEAHGGRIWAESAGRGQGAVFAFALPIEDE